MTERPYNTPMTSNRDEQTDAQRFDESIDLRTAEEIELDDTYRVRVAQLNADEQTRYRGVVVGENVETALSQLRAMSMFGGSKPDEVERQWTRVVDAPHVTADTRYVAVGKAVDTYDEKQEREEFADDDESASDDDESSDEQTSIELDGCAESDDEDEDGDSEYESLF